MVITIDINDLIKLSLDKSLIETLKAMENTLNKRFGEVRRINGGKRVEVEYPDGTLIIERDYA